MKYQIDVKKITDISEQIKELEELLDERIVELHKVNGMQQYRHAYIYYRSLLWDIRDTFNQSFEKI